VAQLSERSIKLPGVARMALVMIDGVKPVAELQSKLGAMGDLDAALVALVSGGLIEIAPAAAPGAAAAPVAAAAAPAAAMSFEELRKWTSRRASTAMGPMGDEYCMRIERAKTREELIAAAERARAGVDSITNSSAKADAFWAEFQKNLNG
jgi:hypothetical protein